MAYAPVEIRHVRLKRGLRGYQRQAVDRLLEEVADSFENVWRERADLADEVERLQGELAHHREHEQLLRMTLVSAERAAMELKEQAAREAGVIVEEARAEARTVTREARTERDRLLGESRRARVLLHAALDTLDEADEHQHEAPRSEIEAA
jgi:cell division initiation protein